MHVRSGVFIPRWETEEWTLALASRLRKLTPSRQAFTLVDLCTGTGCIPILLKDYLSANVDKGLYAKYGKPNTEAKFIGVEKSQTAVEVARSNLERSQPPNDKFPESYTIPPTQLTLDPFTFFIVICYVYQRPRSKGASTLSPAIPHTSLYPPVKKPTSPSPNTNQPTPSSSDQNTATITTIFSTRSQIDGAQLPS